ncbi:iron-containing alcohol dehydrogenase [Oscillospiraceae bacterium PP1C4]
MNNFKYWNPAKIIFGMDSEKEIGKLLAQHHVKSLLLVYSGEFIKEIGIWSTVVQACEKSGIAFFESGDVVPNPKVELVRELTALGKKENIDFVLAVGGGSAIDTAKAVAVGIPHDGDVWDFFDGSASITSAIPVGVISTLPASGSETSNCSIISNGVLKRGIEDDLIIPRFAIMNPSFTLSLPSYQTSCGIADILSHLLERYFTSVEHVDTTDFLIEGAIKALMLNAGRLMDDPSNYHARAEVQWLASIAHNNLLDTGRTADWASHRIEHELSAQYGITHGEGMAIVFVAWTKYMAKIKPCKLAQLANRVFGVDYHDYLEEQMALQLSKKLEDFFKMLNLKTSLKQMDITDKHFMEMSKRATNNGASTIGHYVQLGAEDMVDILYLAY